MRVFVTGGAGYIGSHTCVALAKAGHDVVIYDNLCNANVRVLDRLFRITGEKPAFVEGDVRDGALVEKTLRETKSEAIIHFAGLKAVGESVEKPLDYYDNNVIGTIRIAEAMRAAGVRRIVFSSSATVYGVPQSLPLVETHPLSAINPYGQTKLMSEYILQDFARANPGFCVGLLRYFNPIGAHESGLIGEDPKGIPNNLVPYMTQVAVGRRPFLQIWGNDYDTPDGTGVRDYVHVVDLAMGHVRALEALAREEQSFVVNLGTGRGASVLEVLRAMEKASGRDIPHRFAPRRAGDAAACYAAVEKAERLLHWKAERDLEQMCRDSWAWQSQNPNGYRDA